MTQIKLANPRGFCAGVDRAIDIVDRALDVFGAPIYVRHEVVHNKFVVESLRERGAIFVDEVEQVPDDVILIFSAHGVSQAVRKEAEDRGLRAVRQPFRHQAPRRQAAASAREQRGRARVRTRAIAIPATRSQMRSRSPR